jgi:Ca-activated chloride channel family protein
MNIVEKVTAHKLQTQALADAAQGNIAAATQKLRAAHTVLLDQGETALAQNALAEAERLEKGEGVSNEGRKTMILQSRKTIRLSDPDA